jgi:sugar lactone lactonase YvrE
MLAGDVLELSTDGTIRRQHISKVACVVRRRRGGGMLIATEHDIVLTEGDDLVGSNGTTLAHLLDDPAIRLNEGGVAPDGTFYIGSMAYDETPGAGSLWSVDARGAVAVVQPEATISNGLAWSPDGSTAFYADTRADRIDCFAWTVERGLHDRRPFVDVESPDGLCVDEEGGVWVARWGKGVVHRYGDAGALSEVVPVPTGFPTAVAFVGETLDRLVITTSRLQAPDDPRAGALFEVAPGVRGIPLAEFAG